MSMKLNLFLLCQENTNFLEGQIQHKKQSISSQVDLHKLEKFVEHIRQSGRITINMPQSILLDIITNKKHKNIYEWAESQAEISAHSSEYFLKKRLGVYYEKRLSFDSLFLESKKFRYGALNIEGMGSSAYGSFCIVLKPFSPKRASKSAYLQSDSLNTYLQSNNDVDIDLLKQELAPHTHRHILAGTKLADRIFTELETKWPFLLCSKSDYIEVIFTGNVTPRNLESVRIGQTEYDLLLDFAINGFQQNMSLEERYLVQGFLTILQYLKAHNIPLEIVQDD